MSRSWKSCGFFCRPLKRTEREWPLWIWVGTIFSGRHFFFVISSVSTHAQCYTNKTNLAATYSDEHIQKLTSGEPYVWAADIHNTHALYMADVEANIIHVDLCNDNFRWNWTMIVRFAAVRLFQMGGKQCREAGWVMEMEKMPKEEIENPPLSAIITGNNWCVTIACWQMHNHLWSIRLSRRSEWREEAPSYVREITYTTTLRITCCKVC